MDERFGPPALTEIIQSLRDGYSVYLEFSSPGNIYNLIANSVYEISYEGGATRGAWYGSGYSLPSRMVRNRLPFPGSSPDPENPLILWGVRFFLRDDGSIAYARTISNVEVRDVRGRVQVRR